MEKYFKSEGLVFEIEYFESYSKESATKVQKEVSCEDDYDRLKVEGKHEVRRVNILQEKYSRSSITISKGTVSRLYKFIAEIEAEKCEKTLSEYYA